MINGTKTNDFHFYIYYIHNNIYNYTIIKNSHYLLLNFIKF